MTFAKPDHKHCTNILNTVKLNKGHLLLHWSCFIYKSCLSSSYRIRWDIRVLDLTPKEGRRVMLTWWKDLIGVHKPDRIGKQSNFVFFITRIALKRCRSFWNLLVETFVF